MNGCEPPRDPERDVDAWLREALRDDLPADVEARLEARLRALLFARRFAREPQGGRLADLLDAVIAPATRRAPARLALACVAALLLAAGLALHAVRAPAAVAEPLERIQLSVSLFRALEDVSSLRCSGMTDEAFASAGSLAAHVYRRWVPLGTRSGSAGAIVAVYRSADAAVAYELVFDAATTLPREIRRSDRRAGLGSATCTWTTQRAVSGNEPR